MCVQWRVYHSVSVRALPAVCGLPDFAVLPLALEDPPVGPPVLALPVLQSLHVLALVGLLQFFLLAVPVALPAPVHLPRPPAALVLVVDADQRPEPFDDVVLEVSLVAGPVRILDSPLPVPHVLVELALVERPVFVGRLPSADQCAFGPRAGVFSAGFFALVGAFALWFVIRPLPLVAVAVHGDESAEAVALLSADVSLVEEPLGVEDYHFAGVILGGFPHEGSFRSHCDDVLVDVVAVVPLAAVDLLDAGELGEELWVRQRYTPAAA